MTSAIEQYDIRDEDLEAMKEAFAVFDTNGDGEIDADELQAGFASFGQKRRRSSMLRMIDGVVKGNETQVDFEEFVILMKESEMDGAVDKMLANRDGLQTTVTPDSSEQEEETPDFVASKISLLDLEIPKLADEVKKNWMLAKAKVPEQFDAKHKLMFLRAEYFDAQKAAVRWCCHWDYAMDIFDPERVFLPLTITGALKDDQDFIKLPFYVVTEKYDEFGNRIMFVDHRLDGKDRDAKMMSRAAYYMVMAVLLADEQAQKNGLAWLIYCPPLTSWNMEHTKQLMHWFKNGAPFRFASANICYLPTFFSIMIRIANLFFGKLNARVKLYTGSQEEVVANLASNGFSADVVPTELGGQLVLNHEDWIKTRVAAGL